MHLNVETRVFASQPHEFVVSSILLEPRELGLDVAQDLLLEVGQVFLHPRVLHDL